MINCSECQKPRCIFSPLTLTDNEQKNIGILKEHLLYVCGDEPYEDASIKMRRALTCESPVEIQYYSCMYNLTKGNT
jgi:hypothetical protein